MNLTGGAVPGLSAGLTFGPGSDGSVVRGLAISGFPGSGILISATIAAGPQSIVVQGNHLGISRGLFYTGNGQDGIHVNFADNHTIGQVCGPILGCSGTRNVIAANGAKSGTLLGIADNGDVFYVGVRNIQTDEDDEVTSFDPTRQERIVTLDGNDSIEDIDGLFDII